MGKITVVYQTNDLSTTELLDVVKDYHNENELTNSEIDIIIVPADEEFPDLS